MTLFLHFFNLYKLTEVYVRFPDAVAHGDSANLRQKFALENASNSLLSSTKIRF